MRRHERESQRLGRVAGALEVLAPQRTLERGYAVLLDQRGRALRSPAELRAGSVVEAHLADGVADLRDRRRAGRAGGILSPAGPGWD